MITIVVNHEDGQSDEFDFDSSHANISVGRRSTNDVCIPNLSVSGRHARIVFNDGEAWIEDLNSTNGTYINNRLISRQMLNHNDELVVGKTRVRFENANAGKTLDAAPQAIDDDFDDVDPFDESMPLGTESEPSLEPMAEAPAITPTPELQPQATTQSQPAPTAKPRGTPAQLAAAATAAVAAPAAVAAVVTNKGSSSEAMFESLADDLAERRADTFGGDDELGLDDVDLNEPNLPADDDAPMTLSEKAKLALGRGTARPSLSTANRPAATTSAVAKPAAHAAETTQADDTKVRTVTAATAKADAGVETEKKVGAVIEIKNGAKSGQVLPIDKPVTTLGRPGIQIAAIMRKPDGYFLMHIESDDSVDRPTLNDDAIGDEPMLLQSGDELNVAGINVEFNLA